MTTRVALGLADTMRLVLASVLSAVLLAACASTAQTVRVPWRAGNAARFQIGAIAEHRAQAAYGVLPVTVIRKKRIHVYFRINRLRVFKIANTARLGRGGGQERWLRMGPSENYVAH